MQDSAFWRKNALKQELTLTHINKIWVHHIHTHTYIMGQDHSFQPHPPSTFKLCKKMVRRVWHWIQSEFDVRILRTQNLWVLSSPCGSDGRESACNAETWVWSLGREDPLEEGMTAHSSILAWRMPWTEEPGRLQSMGSQRVRHDWVTFTSLHLPCSGSGHSDSLRWCLGECSQCLLLWLSFEFLLFPVKLPLFTQLFIKRGLMELLGFVLNWVTISFQPHSASLRFFPTAWVGVWDTPGSLQCV